jgi:hypothetical protein
MFIKNQYMLKFKYTSLFVFLTLNISIVFSQNNVGIGTTTPDPSSVLELSSTDKGLLVPRMTTAQRTAIVNPANALLVYDIDVQCYFYFKTPTNSWLNLCQAGPAGPQGPQGNAGTAGIAGATGPTGPQGPSGPAGATGATGAAGPQGATGLSSTPGPQGPAGPQGPIGVTGAAGPAGANGIDGATGPQGPAGPAGATGVAGTAGTNGIDGATGPQGPAGPAGATGIAGTAGTNGIDGAVGPQGPVGPAGATGIAGTAGTNGIDGAVGPQGPVGPAGATGIAGTAGTNGIDGAVGPQGPAGATGIAGAAGANGSDGATGPQGPAGATGVAGPAGATGATGPAGPTWTITTDNFNTDGTLAIVTSIPSTITSTNAAWICSPTTAGTNATTGLRYLGTSTNQHMDLVSNNIVRGRLSNLGEFFIGTTTTALAGDLVNGVSNVTFPWAINGYSSFNGSGIYGSITTGATIFAGVQGEYYGTNTSGAGVRGIAGAGTNNGVNGSNAAPTSGWGGLFQGDLGYTGFFGVASDQRLKQNIQTIPNALNIVKNLRGTTYEHNLTTFPDLGLKTGINYGFIAQEVEQILPNLVREKNIPHIKSTVRGTNESNEAEQMKTVSYIEIVPILVEAIKEQQILIEEMRKEIELLKQK